MIDMWQYPASYLEHVERLVPPDPEEGGGSLETAHGFGSAHVLLSYMPDYLREDPIIRRWATAAGLEVDLLRATLDTVLDAQFVTVTSEWGLRAWEDDTDNPIAPGGVSVEKRRQLVLAKLGYGPRTRLEFGELIESFFGSVEWLIVEDFGLWAVEVTVFTSVVEEERVRFEAMFRARMPAHLDLSFIYGAFIAGISTAGDQL